MEANLLASAKSCKKFLNTYLCFMKANEALIDKLAKLSRLSFDAEEKEQIKADLDRMFAFVEQLEELDTDGISPLIHVSDEQNVFRKDVVNEQLSQKEALKNAPSHDTYYFKVPKVVDKGKD